MYEPEIARRCVACGASIRERALFCPQCGNPVGDETSKLIEPADTVAEPLHPTTTAINCPADLEQTMTESAATQPLATQPLAAPAHPEHVGQRLQRAAAGAKVFEGDVIQRVDQIRKISSVVIDQASYDPSLRFILVAVVLFLLFLTILIMSKLIG